MLHVVPRPLDSRTTFPYKFMNALLCDSIAPLIFGDKNNHRIHYVILFSPSPIFYSQSCRTFSALCSQSMLLPQLWNQVPHSCKTRRQTIRFEVLSAMCVIPVFWSVTPCNVIVFVGNEDGVNKFLTKIGTYFLNNWHHAPQDRHKKF
jgi:hypothetical protein